MSKFQKIIALVGVAVLVIAGVVAKIFSEMKEHSVEENTTSNQKEQTVAAVAPENGKLVKATTSYKNPGGADEVAFSIAVDSTGVITDASTEVLAKNRNSKMYQENFAKALPQAIRGKKLSDLEAIDRTGGASLTTKAFNESLAKLKSEM